MQVQIKMFVLTCSLISVIGCTSGGGGGGEGGAANDEIVRVSRQNNSGTYAYFRETVLGKEREFKLGSIDQSGSKDVVELVSTTPNAIGYSGMGYATPEVTMLAIETDSGELVAPTSENAASRSYPLARGLYIYILGEPVGAMKHYLDWVRSAEGQAIVAEIGYVPVPAVEPPADQAAPPAATIKIAGSDTMVNLAQAWAERYMGQFPDVSVQVSGGGSGVGIAKTYRWHCGVGQCKSRHEAGGARTGLDKCGRQGGHRTDSRFGRTSRLRSQRKPTQFDQHVRACGNLRR